MKILLITLLTVLSLQAATMAERQSKTTIKEITNHSFVLCKRGYEFLVVPYFRGVGVTQIFKESIYMDSGAKPPQPIKCKEK